MATPKFYSVYMTAGSKAEAKKIGRALVAKRLAACVNIIGGMESLYWWKGRIEAGREAVLIAKTTASKVDAFIRAAKSLHSYGTPCIVAWPIAKGEARYLRWVGKEAGA